MPRWRVNQRLSTGVSATGLVNDRPSDIKMPNANRKLIGSRASVVHTIPATTMAAPSKSTKRVPRVLTRCPASGMPIP